MNRTQAAVLLGFISLLVPTLILTITPIPYGKMVGTVTDIDRFTLMSNRIKGYRSRWGEDVSFSYLYNNLTHPSGMAEEVEQSIIDVRLGPPPMVVGFHMGNWSYWSSSSRWLFIEVWTEPYCKLTITLSNAWESWTELHYVNESIGDALAVGRLIEVVSSRPRLDSRMLVFLAWAVGWAGIVVTTIAILRAREMES